MSDTKRFEGFVARINTKSGSTNGRDWTVYSAKIEKASGEEYDEWVSLGFERPKFEEGDYVAFEAEEKKGRLTFVEGSGRKPKNPPARAKKPSASGGANKEGGGYKFDPARDNRITFQAAANRAVEVVTLMLAQDALPITKATSKGNTAKRHEEIEAFINKYTVQFYNDAVTLRLLETVADAGAAVKPAAEPLPEGEDEDDDSGASNQNTDSDDDDEAF